MHYARCFGYAAQPYSSASCKFDSKATIVSVHHKILVVMATLCLYNYDSFDITKGFNGGTSPLPATVATILLCM